jgi:hypothetical protein
MPDLEYIELYGFEDHEDRIKILERALEELQTRMLLADKESLVEKYGSYEEGTR